jgi:Tachylectin
VPGSTACRRTAVRGLTALATVLAAFAVSATSATSAPAAQTTASCASPSVALYHVDAQGRLRRWNFASPLDGGSAGWSQRQIGSGWAGLDAFSGGGGVIFARDSSGTLRWYLDNNPADAGASWAPGSGSAVGSGWGSFTRVFSGGQGVIYAIDPSGALRWYRYLGTNGSAAWDPAGGKVIGSGWNTFAQVFPGGQGVVYGIDSAGGFRWYQNTNPTTPAGTWSGNGTGAPIGSGWNRFTRIASMGGGVILGRDAGGNLLWYRNTDPLGGTASWANGGIAVNEGIGWNGNDLIADVNGCSAS